MVKKCVYCSKIIEDERAVDVCDICGYKVWGERMFKAIKENMSQAEKKGDLFQGTVNDELQKSISENSFKIKV